MNVYQRLVPAHVRFLLAVQTLLLLIFTLFRSVTLLYNRPSYLFDIDRTLSLSAAFRIGFLFDIRVASYAVLPPFLVLTLAYIFSTNRDRVFTAVRVYCVLAILVSLAICAADVPYFNFFNSRITTAAVHWKNNLQVAQYVLSEIKYYPFILIFFGGVWAIRRLIRMLWEHIWRTAETFARRGKIISTAGATLLLLVGLWGGATPRAPEMKSAYFSEDGFINQLTLNPVHTWFDSYFDFKIDVCTKEEAIRAVQKSLGIKNSQHPSPIAREHRYEAPPRPKNVVLVLLESMSAGRMGIYGNKNNLTPRIDSLARNSVFFDRCYSNGIHTNAGLYSTLFGMPIRMMQHPMYNGHSEHIEFSGLPMTLRDNGYRTLFFCTHAKTFDNLDVFLGKNGFDYISDVKDYPNEKVANAWGVGDETLYEHVLGSLDSLDQLGDGQPFFATVLTITTHPPYNLPAFTRFKPRSADPVEATYEYADWAFGNFIEACAERPWYKNTVFVVVGDHGVNLPSQYDVPLSYNHVPLIMHAPGLPLEPSVRHDLANQTDIFPTVMGLLRIPYVQNTLGFDLFREKRPFAFFSQDHKLGVLNDQYLYVMRKSGAESLYNYRHGYPDNLLDLQPVLADSMKNFACTHLQVAQWLIEHQLTGEAQAWQFPGR